MRLFRLWLFSILVFTLMAGCQKNDDPVTPEPEPRPEPSQPFTMQGKAYFNHSPNRMVSVDLESGAVDIVAEGIKYGNVRSPSAYEDGIFYSANEYGISAADVNSRKILWQFEYSHPNYISYSFFNFSAIVIDEELLYVVGRTGSSGEHCLYAIDKKTGVIRWQKITSPSGPRISAPAPVISGDRVVVRITAFINGGEESNRMKAFDKRTGQLLWDQEVCNCKLSERAMATDKAIYAHGYYKRAVTAIDAATGKRLWEKTVDAEERFGSNTERLFASANDLVYVGLTVPYFFNLNTGEYKKGEMDMSNIRSWQVTDDAYYLSSDSYLAAYNKSDHKLLWRWASEVKRANDSLPSSPNKWSTTNAIIATDRYIILPAALSNNSNFVYNHLFIFDRFTGKLLKKLPIEGTFRLSQSFKYGTVVTNGKVYHSAFAGNARTY